MYLIQRWWLMMVWFSTNSRNTKRLLEMSYWTGRALSRAR